MTTVNDLLKIFDIDVVLFNKASNKLAFVSEELFNKAQFFIKNTVLTSEVNVFIATLIITVFLYLLDPLGKRTQTEKVSSVKVEPKVETESTESKSVAESVKAVIQPNKTESVKEEIVTRADGKKQTKIVYHALDDTQFDAFIAELRNPGYEVTRVKKDKAYKKILRLNNEGMLYWSKESKIFGKHLPWKPESFYGTEQNRTAGTFTLKFKSPNGDARDYVLKVDAPLSSEKIIQGLTDLAMKKNKDKEFGTKIPPTPAKGKFTNPESLILTTTENAVEIENVATTPSK